MFSVYNYHIVQGVRSSSPAVREAYPYIPKRVVKSFSSSDSIDDELLLRILRAVELAIEGAGMLVYAYSAGLAKGIANCKDDQKKEGTEKRQ